MNLLVPIALYGWIVVVLLLFSLLPARRAVIAAFIGGWLFLPVASIHVQGLPDIDKISVTSFAALLGVVLFDAKRLLAFRPKWFDLPMAIWCLVPVASSVSNGLGSYDGFSFALSKALLWGAPYLLGRLYFDRLEALRELAIGIAIGGIVYVPFCLLEVRLSPQLHRWIYGYHPSAFVMTLRFGGYRPMVFMHHGLMLALWMSSAGLVSFWLWSSGAVRRVRGVPMVLIAAAILATAVLCKSVGALALLAGGIATLFACRWLRLNLVIYAVVLIVPLYMFVRAQGLWHGEQLVALATEIDRERAESFEVRLLNEDLILENALRKPLWGWGGWGRWRVEDELGKDITVSDGMWVIALGETGLVGLIAFTTATLLPVLLLLRRVPAKQWAHAAAAPAAGLAMLLVLHALDNLVNAMPNPIYYLGAGGLAAYYAMAPALRRAAMGMESRK